MVPVFPLRLAVVFAAVLSFGLVAESSAQIPLPVQTAPWAVVPVAPVAPVATTTVTYRVAGGPRAHCIGCRGCRKCTSVAMPIAAYPAPAFYAPQVPVAPIGYGYHAAMPTVSAYYVPTLPVWTTPTSTYYKHHRHRVSYPSVVWPVYPYPYPYPY